MQRVHLLFPKHSQGVLMCPTHPNTSITLPAVTVLFGQ